MLIPDHVSLSIPNQVMNLPLPRSLPGLTQLVSHPLFLLVTIHRIWNIELFNLNVALFLVFTDHLTFLHLKMELKKKKDCYTYGMFHDEI